jgi:SagB-type dehydrogenase family enzyme
MLGRAFHDRTTHTPQSVRTSGHMLEWDIKPFPFKVYTDLASIPLPRAIDPIATDTLVALTAPPASARERLTLERLTALLYFSAGVTKKKTYPGGGEVLFRAAASTGALYQTEVYVAAGDVEGVPAGLYHFSPGDFVLRRLRDGDVRGNLAEAAADDSLGGRAAIIVLSAIYWRNTWKYQARGYRHLFWDSGTMLANLVAVANAIGAGPRIVTGFVDADVNRVLALDPDREAALELVAVGPEGTRAHPPVLENIAPATMPLSSSEVDYPELREMHRASMLDSPATVSAWRRSSPPPRRRPTGSLIALPPARAEAGRGLGDTIQRRGSTRRFGHAPLSTIELGTALASATRPVAADVPGRLVDLYMVVNAVDGIEPGGYCYWPEEHALELVRAGEFRGQSAYLTLEQALGGDAAVTVFFLAPLDAILLAFGDRGYRLANLEAGLIGGRLYLGAYAQGFGASGLTFYDREVVRFFSPHATGLDAIFVTALGRSSNVGSEDVLIPRPRRRA